MNWLPFLKFVSGSLGGQCALRRRARRTDGVHSTLSDRESDPEATSVSPTRAGRAPVADVNSGGFYLSASDLGTLPYWARAAFAARCAGRALRLVEGTATPLPVRSAAALAWAVRQVEESAAVARPADGLVAAAERARTAAEAVDPVQTAACAAAHAAAFAAVSALTPAEARKAAHRAYGNARHAAAALGAADVLADIAADFERVRTAAAREQWKDDTAVGPGVFG